MKNWTIMNQHTVLKPIKYEVKVVFIIKTE